MKKILILLAAIASLVSTACAGPNLETATALAEKHAQGKSVYTMTHQDGTTLVLVCTENSVVPVVVSGNAASPKVEGSRTNAVGMCNEPVDLWRTYNEALTDYRAKDARAAMAALQAAIKK